LVKYLKRHRQHTFTLALILVIGIGLTALSVFLSERNEFRLWQLSAIAEAERMSTELIYRMEREREPLISLAALFQGSEEVTLEELRDARSNLVALTKRESELSVAWISEQSQRLDQVVGNIPWLHNGTAVSLPQELEIAYQTALAEPSNLVIAPLFRKDSRSYIVMSVAVANDGQRGVLMVVSYFDDILARVAEDFIGAGKTLEIYQPYNPLINYAALAPLESEEEATHRIYGEFGNQPLELVWKFDADYSPLWQEENAEIGIIIVGLSLTFLITLTYGSILFQNIRLETLVAQRTRQLKNTFRGLQQAQSQLVKQERMAALGSLVAGVAHELSTPISNAMMSASIIVENFNKLKKKAGELEPQVVLKELDRLAEAAQLLQHNTFRASELISSFKQVSIDQTSARKREFDLEKTIEQVITTLGPELRKSQVKTTIVVPQVIQCESYPGQLGQVLTNLIQNAVVHGYEGVIGGEIKISAHTERCGQVEIVVEDFGKGMPEAVKRRVFEPFFTTKLGKGGSGLGMHITYNIVDTVLGGSIEVYSTEGKGTRFILRIPNKAPETKKLFEKLDNIE